MTALTSLYPDEAARAVRAEAALPGTYAEVAARSGLTEEQSLAALHVLRGAGRVVLDRGVYSKATPERTAGCFGDCMRAENWSQLAACLLLAMQLNRWPNPAFAMCRISTVPWPYSYTIRCTPTASRARMRRRRATASASKSTRCGALGARGA